MFDVTFGEFMLVGAVGFFLIGKQDLPKAFHMAGKYTGRMVGFLQGARVRAERFAAESELKQLHNEFRSGLRELDLVKSELAVTMSSRGMIGRELGATTANVNRPQPQLQNNTSWYQPSTSSTDKAQHELKRSDVLSPSNPEPFNVVQSPKSSSILSTPSAQTIGAVAEQEWMKQGIGFISRGEKEFHRKGSEKAGSIILSEVYEESLVHDQYDRVVAEQDTILQTKANAVFNKQANKESDG